MSTYNPPFVLTLSAVALVLSLAACGNQDEKKVATQVAAKVGSEEISVHQINQVLQRSNASSPEAAKAVSRAVLEKLIDQQLAVEQATEAKLHRSPEVIAQLEAARREILSRAYMQKVGDALPKPSPDAVKKYFAQHSQLFSERRIYNLQEIVVSKTAAATETEQLRTLVASAKNIDEVTAALKARGIAFNSGGATRAAEQIPLELLAQLHNVKDGQGIVFDTPQTATYVLVISSQIAPVSEATAMPRIEQFLANQRATEAVAADLKRLRANTRITYMGEFVQANGSAATASSPAVPVSANEPDKQPVAPVDAVQSAIEKGAAGLK